LLASLGLCLNKPESVIICTRCKYALQPSADTISKHLAVKHQTSATARRGLTAFVRSLVLQDPNKLALRTDGCLPHPDLLILQGVACKLCLFRSTSRDLMQRHMSKEHEQRTGQKDCLGDNVRDNLSLQSWTQSGPRSYWIVEPAVDTVLPEVGTHMEGSPRRRAMVSTIHEEEEQHLAQLDRDCSAIDEEPDDIALIGPWMRRTGWATTFAGADRRLLSLLSQSPAVGGRHLELGCYGTRILYSTADDERHLVAIGRAVDRFFDRCEDTARHTEHSIRCWLKSQIPGRPYKAPFEIPGRQTTTTRYRRWWKRMMYAFFRLYRIDDAARDEFLRMRLSDKQREALELVWTTAQVHVRNTEEGIDEMDVEENDDEDDIEHEDEEEEYDDDEDDEDDVDDDGEEEDDEEYGTSDGNVHETPRNRGIDNGIPTQR
jgi:hypothetical protein